MKATIRTSLLIFLLIITSFFKQDTRSEYILPSLASSIFATDIDHDGFNDLITGHKTGWGETFPTITVLKNIAWGTFNIIDTSKKFSGYQYNIFAIDINNDTWADIVSFYSDFSTGTARRYIRIYYNSNGSFPNNECKDFNLDSSDIINGIDHGDFNGDGHPDIVVYSNSAFFFGVFYNDGNGDFLPPVYYDLINPQCVACGDLNGDGLDDIVGCGDDTYIFYATPGGFSQTLLDPMVTMQNAAVVDFDLDGRKDILTEKYVWMYQYSVLKMFKNLGNGDFQLMPEYYFTPGAGPLHIADFNNDSYPDILFAGVGGHIIWYNQGNFQIADSQYVAIPYYGEQYTNVFLADLDNNAFNDIATVRFNPTQNPANLDLRFNDGHGNFIPDPIVGVQIEAGSYMKIQSYPNPFHDFLSIEFDIKEKSFVNVSLFDSQGKKIQCICNQLLDKGHHFYQWVTNSDLNNGIYIIVLTENNRCSGISKIVKN